MKGRGIDFQHRFNTSRWAEDLLIHNLNEEYGLVIIRYGLSTVVPEGQNLIYDRNNYKEPDLLVFDSAHLTSREKLLLQDGVLSWEDRVKLDTNKELPGLLKKVLVALEVEFSPYKAKEMKDRNWIPRTDERWHKRPLKNAELPKAPNIWVKLEDLGRLFAWEKDFGIPIVIAHLFDQEGFAIALSKIENFHSRYNANPEERIYLQVTGGIFQKEQKYDRVDAQGAGETKTVFVVAPAAAEKIGNILDVKVGTQLGTSSSMKYVSHIIFSEGKLEAESGFLNFLRSFSKD